MSGLSPLRGGGGGGRIFPNLLCPTHIFFIFKTIRLILDVVPCYRVHHRTPNTVSINHVPMTSHRTPNTVSINHVPMISHRTPNTLSIFTLHSHPCHYLFIPRSTYIMRAICACLLMHNYPCSIWTFISKAYKFQIYHTFHSNISIHTYIDITSHYHSSSNVH